MKLTIFLLLSCVVVALCAPNDNLKRRAPKETDQGSDRPKRGVAATAKNPCGVHTILEPLIEVEIDGQTYQTVPFYDWDDQSFKYPMLNYEECNEGDSHLGIFRCQKFDLDMMVWVYTMDPIGNYEVTRAIYTRKNGRCGLAY